jgi:parallel beta-helix repeat protein
MSYIPVTTCTSIAKPGHYRLENQILGAQDDCIAISSSNVVLNCENYSIGGNGVNSQGYAATIRDASNVVIDGCTFSGFSGGINVYGSKNINISKVNIENVRYGIMLNATGSSDILNDFINDSEYFGIRLLGVNSTTVLHNVLQYGPDAPGILLNGSTLNRVDNNTIKQYRYGMEIIGGSRNNTINNNTASSSGAVDYLCGTGNMDLAAEQGGINYGSSKQGCRWMAMVQTIGNGPPCTAFLAADTFILSSDYAYSYGSVCFSVLSNSSTINCNGHTIISTDGGTFAKVGKGTKDSVIENCYLKDFSTPIVAAANGSAEIYNNTILDNGSAKGISVLGGFLDGSVVQNNVTGGGTAFAIYNSVDSSLKNNFAYRANTGYYVYNAVGITATGDYAAANTTYGMVLNSTAVGSFGGLMLDSGDVGFYCQAGSQTSPTLTDQGSNYCSSQSSCNWLGLSKSSC